MIHDPTGRYRFRQRLTTTMVALAVCTSVTLLTPPVAAAPTAAAAAAASDQRDKAELLRAKAQELVSGLVQTDGAPGAAAYIIAPKLGLMSGVAAGTTRRSGRDMLTAEHPIRIASVTKPFVATAILRLWEMGKLELDRPIRAYLTPAQVTILEDGNYDVEAITTRRLLAHTSGLVDFFFTKEFQLIEPKLRSGEMKHRFTVDEQLKMAMEEGPRFAPGQAFDYTDTGYILPGAILENETGNSMGAATRDLVGFDRLGLTQTWWEVMEPQPRSVVARVHQYDRLGRDINNEYPSFDLLGGGGIVSTPRDMATFFYALFRGQVFSKPETIHVMVSVDETATPRKRIRDVYGYGVRIHKVGDLTVYAHGGSWGLEVGYVPELDMAVSVIGTRQDIRSRYAFAFDELIKEAARLNSKRQKHSPPPAGGADIQQSASGSPNHMTRPLAS